MNEQEGIGGNPFEGWQPKPSEPKVVSEKGSGAMAAVKYLRDYFGIDTEKEPEPPKYRQPFEIRTLAEGLIEGIETSESDAKAFGFQSVYDVPYQHGKYVDIPEGKRLSEMTIGEVKKLQRQQIDNTKGKIGRGDYGTGAMGRYQIVGSTLRVMQEQLDLTDDDIFSPEVQDKMFERLLIGRGLNDYKKGKISKEEFMENLKKEWEGLTVDKNQTSFNSAIDAIRVSDRDELFAQK